MRALRIDDRLVDRLYRQARADRWQVSISRFTKALAASAERAFAERLPNSRELARYVAALHLEDLALACACVEGDEAAWEQFVREQRPQLYRAADALDPSGGARELADCLYADLYGLDNRSGERQSLLRYFHGRSSIATWLRAVLAQRYVDRLRTQRRMESLPEDESISAVTSVAVTPPDPDRSRYLMLTHRALERALSSLNARDRLRLACYYAQELTLAQTGHLLGEHEATVSRQLARTRRALREAVERDLRDVDGLSQEQIARCLECVTDDVGPLDLRELLGAGGERKESGRDRSL